MDEYLSEKEQIERIRDWWRENGWYLVAGAALGAAALIGLNQYRGYTEQQAEQAAALYLDLQNVLEDDDRAAADALLSELREEYPSSPYTDHAGLLLAGTYIVSEPARAARELRYVMENTEDDELSLIARLRLARVLIYQESFDEALQLLDITGLGQFAAQYSEVKGDAYYARGDIDAARMAYAEALSSPGAEWVNRGFIEMKLGALEVPAAGSGSGA